MSDIRKIIDSLNEMATVSGSVATVATPMSATQRRTKESTESVFNENDAVCPTCHQHECQCDANSRKAPDSPEVANFGLWKNSILAGKEQKAKKKSKVKESVTDYDPKSQGGTRKELLAKLRSAKSAEEKSDLATRARKAGASQKELQDLSEGDDQYDGQYDSKAEAIAYAKEKVKSFRDWQDGIEIWALPSGEFDVVHTMNSNGRNHVVKNGGKKLGTIYPEKPAFLKKKDVAESSVAADDVAGTLNSYGYYTKNAQDYVHDKTGDRFQRVGSQWKHQSGTKGRGPEELDSFLSSKQGVAEAYDDSMTDAEWERESEREKSEKEQARKEIEKNHVSQFKTKEEAIQYANDKLKTFKNSSIGMSVYAMPDGGFDVCSTARNSAGEKRRKLISDAGGKHLGTLGPRYTKHKMAEGGKSPSPGWMLRQDPALAKKVKDAKAGYQDLKKYAGKDIPKKEVKEQNWSRDPWKEKEFGPTTVIKKIFKITVQDSESNVKAFNVKAETEQQAREIIEKHAPGSTVKSIKFVKNLMAEGSSERNEMDTPEFQSSLARMKSRHQQDDKDFNLDSAKELGRRLAGRGKRDDSDKKIKEIDAGRGQRALKLAEQDFILNPHDVRRISRDVVPKVDPRQDHEVEMACSDLFQAAKNAREVLQLIKDIPESVGLEGWVQEKIIKASDYLNTVREYLEGQQVRSAMSGNYNMGNMLDESVDNPLEAALVRRIMSQHTDVLQQYGPKNVLAAISDVAREFSPDDELGTSDVSAYVKQVLSYLHNYVGDQIDEEDHPDVAKMKKHISDNPFTITPPVGIKKLIKPDEEKKSTDESVAATLMTAAAAGAGGILANKIIAMIDDARNRVKDMQEKRRLEAELNKVEKYLDSSQPMAESKIGKTRK